VMSKLTLRKIKAYKNSDKLVMITAYDYLFAKLFNKNVEMILVGDSLNMSFGGHNDTLSASLDVMIYHTNAVCKGAPETFVVCDMPFGTYMNRDDALKNALRVYQETGADAVKIEGGKEKADIVQALSANGIAVVGHIGLLPQFFRSEGYAVKGKDERSEEALIEDAKAIEKAGAFCIVIEGVKADVATKISQAVKVPTIGIGAGSGTDGQVLVWSDMLGLFEDFTPKFVRQYLEGAKLVKSALSHYTRDVKSGEFPKESESY
jgi:3-methyl-2-oxobutanoate hydroxymethyltransferase